VRFVLSLLSVRVLLISVIFLLSYFLGVQLPILSPISDASSGMSLILSPAGATPAGSSQPLLVCGETPSKATARRQAVLPVSLGAVFGEGSSSDNDESEVEEEGVTADSSGNTIRPPPGRRPYSCKRCGQPKKGHMCSNPEGGGASKVVAKKSERASAAASNSPRGVHGDRKTLLDRRKKLKLFFAQQAEVEKEQGPEYVEFWFKYMEAYKLKIMSCAVDHAAGILKWGDPVERKKAQDEVEEAWFHKVTEVWLNEWKENSAHTLIDLDNDDSVAGLVDEMGGVDMEEDDLRDDAGGVDT